MTDEELLAEVVVEAVELGFDPDVARSVPDAAIAWVDAEGDRLAALAVEAGFDPEMARKDRVAAVRSAAQLPPTAASQRSEFP